MICEKYQNDVMALLDGELDGTGRREVENHLACCEQCNAEYHKLQKLLATVSSLNTAKPCNDVFREYWDGVCRKMERRGSWNTWRLVSACLFAVGLLLVFGLEPASAGLAPGVLALLSSGVLLFLSFFCTCGR